MLVRYSANCSTENFLVRELSIKNFARIVFPSPKRRECLVAHHLNHRNLALCVRLCNFLVDSGIIEAGPGRIRREVNDQDWEVGLHIVFKDRASHDAYQLDAEHVKFVEENKAGWVRARVFDSVV